MENKFVTYTATCYEGYLGDFATEWWNEEDWAKYRKEVEHLKKEGRFGKPFELTVKMLHNPLFDESNVGKIKSSYEFEIINLSNEK